MEKSMAERIREMAEMLSQKAEEIKQRIEGVEANVNTPTNQRVSKQSQERNLR